MAETAKKKEEKKDTPMKRYRPVEKHLEGLVVGGMLSAEEAGVAFLLLRLWWRAYCPDKLELTSRKIGEIAKVNPRKISAIMKRLEELELFQMSRPRPTGGVTLDLCKNLTLVMSKSYITKNKVMSESYISNVRILHNSTLYNNNNTNIYIERLEKFLQYFREQAPVVSEILTDPPTLEELDDLKTYRTADIKDALKALEADPTYIADKRNAYHWIKNKLAYLERKPMPKQHKG